MAVHGVDEVMEAVRRVGATYHRLVLLVAPARSGKTRVLREVERAAGWPLVNLNLQLSQRLLDLTRRQRAVAVSRIVDDLLRDIPGEVLMLDNIELLFDPELATDPLRLLQSQSRVRTVVAAWPGTLEGGQLTYATPTHPEWHRYPEPDAAIIQLEMN